MEADYYNRPPTRSQIGEIYAVASRALRARAVPEHDVSEWTQETVVHLYQAWNAPHIVSVRSQGGVVWQGYIARTARNQWAQGIRRDIRRQLRERRHLGLPEDDLPRRPNAHRSSLAVRDTSPQEDFVSRESLMERITVLPTTDCQIARLWLFSDMPMKEIAALVGVPLSTVYRRRQQIAKALNELQIVA